MKTYVFNAVVLVLIIGLSAWLYSDDGAARPGGLSSDHAAFDDCSNCHVPWKAVENRMCLQCHFFDDVRALKPQIRFHEAGKYCLGCHTEHLGYGGDISRMDHTLLNGALSCTQCHVDPHDTKFGSDCRTCHGITTWNIDGYRHPPYEEKNCSRCHSAPASHRSRAFWQEILNDHEKIRPQQPPPKPDQCWRCHIPHRWDHLLIKNPLEAQSGGTP